MSPSSLAILTIFLRCELTRFLQLGYHRDKILAPLENFVADQKNSRIVQILASNRIWYAQKLESEKPESAPNRNRKPERQC